ncbi:hypothetical protein ACSLNR_28270, partial [Escherichia coli]|uniref:hypothetical protein n=1 Tax=Escherichia coli TaxID=562 RepID=UPI003EE013A1
QERKLLHVLATAEKNDLQAQESERKQAVQKRIEGKKQRRERNMNWSEGCNMMLRGSMALT